jgi:hypothetical protein
MPDEKRPLVFRGTLDVKRAIVLGLREVFASDIIEERYRWRPVPDPKNLRTTKEGKDDDGGALETKIKIYRSFPKRMIYYPSIVVHSRAFDASLTSMGEEREEQYGQQLNGVFKMTYGGHMVIPIELKIYSKDNTYDRDKLTDTLLIIVKIMQRSVFARFGLGYVTIKVGGDAEYEAGDGVMVFTNTVTLYVVTDWSLDLDPDESELFEKVYLKVLAQAQAGDPLELLGYEDTPPPPGPIHSPP